jgi:hypothetical protein
LEQRACYGTIELSTVWKASEMEPSEKRERQQGSEARLAFGAMCSVAVGVFMGESIALQIERLCKATPESMTFINPLCRVIGGGLAAYGGFRSILRQDIEAQKRDLNPSERSR